MMRITLFTLTAALVASIPASGQVPAVTPQNATTTTPAVTAPPLEPSGYTYNAAGRRDPFISLVRRTTEAAGTSANPRPKGLAGLSLGELRMTGVVRGSDGWIALVKAVDNRSYTVKPGDKLFDGTVRRITADAMFVVQDVNDPLSLVKQREVRKPLRPSQEAQ